MLEEPLLEAPPEADEILSQNKKQNITYDGRIKVSTKAWAFRIVALTSIAFILLLNLYQGIKIRDPLVFYSTLMPLHELGVFAIGWLFYRSKAQGFVTDDLVSVIIPIFNQREMIEIVINAIFMSKSPL